MKEVYIVNCCRTPIGSYGGALKDTPAVELGAIAVREALRRANVKPEWVDEVIFGGVLPPVSARTWHGRWASGRGSPTPSPPSP